jgi:hypothetical protein
MATHHTSMVVSVERDGDAWVATCDAMPGWRYGTLAKSETVALWYAAAAVHDERARRLRKMASDAEVAAFIAREAALTTSER